MTRALLISNNFPWNDTYVHGVFNRLDVHVQALLRVADEVDCLFLVDAQQPVSPAEATAHERRLQDRWSPKVRVRLAPTLKFGSANLSRWERQIHGIYSGEANALLRPFSNDATRAAIRQALQDRPQLIFAHRLGCMLALESVREPHAPVCFDLDDIEHIALFRRLLHSPSWPLERLMLSHVPALALRERSAITAATSTLVCSEADREYLFRWGAGRGVHVLPNSVAKANRPARPPGPPTVLFIGTFGYRPNAAAADFLVREIWPQVRAAIPLARLLIVGRKPESLASYSLKPPGVEFAGFVDNLDDVYAQADIMCCPILFGGGTRVKIVEAAVYGVPVVATPVAAEGLSFASPEEIVLAPGAAELAAQCVALLNDPARAQRIGLAARRKAAENYDRDAILDRLETILQDTLPGGESKVLQTS